MKEDLPVSSHESSGRAYRALAEAAGLLRGPQRLVSLISKVASDELRRRFEQPTLYSYTKPAKPTARALRALINWMLAAQRADGGIAAYYGLLNGYSNSYPEVTGYIIPTLYDFSRQSADDTVRGAAERATSWLLSLQMPLGAFPGGLHGSEARPSIFNTGQILQGLVRAYVESRNPEILKSAVAAGEWLAQIQQVDGSWGGPAAYQGVAHTYYSMVSWALAQLAQHTEGSRYTAAVDRNLDWVLSHFQPSGWIDGINLRGHPTYLHFIAYVIQGVLETGILREREDAVHAAGRSAWVLLREFERYKRLRGSYEVDFRSGPRFACLTGNAQMSCVWLRLYEVTRDLRYLNAALKMNEMLKDILRVRGRRGVAGGVAGSFPVWDEYQPMRYISWGAKFLADALMLEQRLTHEFEVSGCAS